MTTYVFRKPSRPISRVFVHCSASDNPDHDNVATMDLWHKQRGWAGVGYHFFIRKNGMLEIGRSLELTPAAQENNNIGTIAICLHGLKAEKFTQAQFATLITLCRQIDAAYSSAVTFHGHCEVARKACPVFDYKRVLGLDAKGRLSAKPVLADSGAIEMPRTPGIEHLEEPGSLGIGVLHIGSKSGAVTDLQKKLVALGYFVGNIDGEFGTRTRDSVMAWQADNHLTPDGRYGPLSREAMRDAKPRPVSETRAVASLASLSANGSGIARATIDSRLAGIVLSAGGVLGVVNEVTGFFSTATGSLGEITKTLEQYGLSQGAVMIALGAYVVWKSIKAGRAHVEDFRSGKTA
ncbi:peptidoglycan recognition protein family protein [Rhizobium herbae]|uniref:N-acetylmuramoyl-L-alanine amidase n=1 Tax=Rhizobium herbae TaxID=508661 RepID=A0ABS4EWI3_9HYPH|nr:peptidoglycan-binding domain-containing protein [Rhizobium herbae]MBP1862161.1 hypothetical protein [Rhizobium herbae]